jgi:hypothetical protein
MSRSFARPLKWTWLLAFLFADVVGLAVGSFVFCQAMGQLAPPSLPPGAVWCGNAEIGGLFGMFVGAPFCALASGLVAGAFGAASGHALDRWAQNRREPE